MNWLKVVLFTVMFVCGHYANVKPTWSQAGLLTIAVMAAYCIGLVDRQKRIDELLKLNTSLAKLLWGNEDD